MCDCERSTYVQTFVCVKCLISFEVICVKHKMKKLRSVPRNVERIIFFWLLEVPRQTTDI